MNAFAWVLLVFNSLLALTYVLGIFMEDEKKERAKSGVNLLFKAVTITFFAIYLFG